MTVEQRDPEQIHERHWHVAGDAVRGADGLGACGFAGIEPAEAGPRRLDLADLGGVDAARDVETASGLAIQCVVDQFGEIVDGQIRRPVLDRLCAGPAHGSGHCIGLEQQCREEWRFCTADRDAPLAE